MSFQATANALRAETDTSTEKLILVVICDCANNETGIAWPSSEYLAIHTMCSPRTVRRSLQALETQGWLAIERVPGRVSSFLLSEALISPEQSRGIINKPYPGQIVTPGSDGHDPGHDIGQEPHSDNDNGRNLSLTNQIQIDDPKKSEEKKSKRFAKPSIDDLFDYMMTIHTDDKNDIWTPFDEATSFHDYHQSRGWVVGKNPMKDWKAAVRTWLKNQEKFNARSQRNHQKNPKLTSSDLAKNIDF